MDDDIERFLKFYSERFVDVHGYDPSAATVVAKTTQLRKALEVAGCDSLEELALVVDDVDFCSALWEARRRPMTPGAQRVALFALRDFGEFAMDIGLARTNCFADIATPRHNRSAGTSTWSDEELETILEAARLSGDTRWHALLLFLALTGRRIGETLNLRWRDVRARDTVPHVILRVTKNGVPAAVPIGTEVRALFSVESRALWRSARLLGEAEHGRGGYHTDPNVFVFPWQYRSVRARLERLCIGESIPYRAFHEFRRTRITSWFAEGLQPQAVMALVGHKSIQTTMRFYNATSAMSYWRYLK